MKVKFVTAVAALAAVTGCGGLFQEEIDCTMELRASGIDLRVKAPLARTVEGATMTVCWGGACQSPSIELTPDTVSVPQGCTGDRPDDSCGASASPTGDQRAFAQIRNLPAKPVDVAVILRDADGRSLLDQRITVTPRPAKDPGCPGAQGGEPPAQADIDVVGGRLTPRP